MERHWDLVRSASIVKCVNLSVCKQDALRRDRSCSAEAVPKFALWLRINVIMSCRLLHTVLNFLFRERLLFVCGWWFGLSVPAIQRLEKRDSR